MFNYAHGWSFLWDFKQCVIEDKYCYWSDRQDLKNWPGPLRLPRPWCPPARPSTPGPPSPDRTCRPSSPWCCQTPPRWHPPSRQRGRRHGCRAAWTPPCSSRVAPACWPNLTMCLCRDRTAPGLRSQYMCCSRNLERGEKAATELVEHNLKGMDNWWFISVCSKVNGYLAEVDVEVEVKSSINLPASSQVFSPFQWERSNNKYLHPSIPL